MVRLTSRKVPVGEKGSSEEEMTYAKVVVGRMIQRKEAAELLSFAEGE